jgi:hypothetical protein
MTTHAHHKVPESEEDAIIQYSTFNEYNAIVRSPRAMQERV